MGSDFGLNPAQNTLTEATADEQSQMSNTSSSVGPLKKYFQILEDGNRKKFLPSSIISLSSGTETQSLEIQTETSTDFLTETGALSTDSCILEGGTQSQQIFESKNSSSESDLEFEMSNSSSPNSSKFVKHKCQKIEVRYQKGKILGMGTKNSIYEGRNLKTGKTRAIKTINSFQTVEKKNYQKKEIELLSTFDHPNLIRLIEVYEHKHKVHMVLERCEGGNLTDVRRIMTKSKIHQNFKIYIIKYIMKQVLQTIAYLHSKGFAHLNLKMKKIMLLKKQICPVNKNMIKIIDLSMARSSSNDMTFLQGIRPKILLLGSPQQIIHSSYCFATDIWHLGVIFFRFVTGFQPYNISNHQNKRQLHKNKGKWEFIRSIQLKNLLQNMLKIEPSQRWSAIKCLQHQWFSDASFGELNILQNHLPALSKKQRKKTSLFAYVESALVFRNHESLDINQISSIFKELDEDCSGSVRLQELIQGLRKIQNKQNKDILSQAIKIFQEIDTDKSGQIDYREFLNVLIDKEKLFSKELIEEIFQNIDTDNSGFIGKEEFLSQISNNPMQYERYLQKMGNQFNNLIRKEDFVSYILQEYEYYKKNV